MQPRKRLPPPQPPVAKRAARAPRRRAHAHRRRAHLRRLQPALPRPQNVAVLVQRLRRHQRLQCPPHTAHLPHHLLQLGHQPAPIRFPFEELQKRYEGAALLQISREEKKRELDSDEPSGSGPAPEFDAVDARQLQHGHDSAQRRLMRLASPPVPVQGGKNGHFLINGEHGRGDRQ